MPCRPAADLPSPKDSPFTESLNTYHVQTWAWAYGLGGQKCMGMEALVRDPN